MGLNKKTVDDINVKGKRVLVRCDFNVPLKDGVITDENRLKGALPTIKYLIENGAKVILCSHLGKDASKSLAPVAVRLSEMLGKTVVFAADQEVVGENARKAVADMKNGDVVLLENTRCRKEETKNGEELSKELASLCDIYVNDAFGTAHRAHSSTEGVTKFVDTAVCGYLIQKELKFLGEAVNNPVRPFVAILGGAKVSDKIAVIENLLDKVNTLIIGGGMAYTFLKAQGYSVGNSLVEEDRLDYAKKMIADAEAKGVRFLLPVDHRVAAEFKDVAPVITEDQNIQDGFMGLDIGPKTEAIYAEAIKDAKTVIWNGPMGVFEFENFTHGSRSVGEAIVEATKNGAFSLVGGGDSVACVNKFGLASGVSYVSTGGGALLEAIEGKILPGIAAINE